MKPVHLYTRVWPLMLSLTSITNAIPTVSASPRSLTVAESYGNAAPKAEALIDMTADKADAYVPQVLTEIPLEPRNSTLEARFWGDDDYKHEHIVRCDATHYYIPRPILEVRLEQACINIDSHTTRSPLGKRQWLDNPFEAGEFKIDFALHNHKAEHEDKSGKSIDGWIMPKDDCMLYFKDILQTCTMRAPMVTDESGVQFSNGGTKYLGKWGYMQIWIEVIEKNAM